MTEVLFRMMHFDSERRHGAAVPSGMRTWEYRTVRAASVGKGLDLEELNRLGAEGWKAFAAVPAALDGYAYQDVDGVYVLLRRSSLQ